MERDANKKSKGLKLESEYQTHPHQPNQVCSSVALTACESSANASSLLKSATESLVQGISERFESKVRDINEKLQSLAQKGVALGLNPSMGFGYSRPRVFSERPPTGSVVNRSKVFGREEDLWKIIRWLLSEETPTPGKTNNSFSVMPIVGMGGAGKTTLAQLVYNHDIVKNHFHLKAWVCVSEDFDVVKLTKEILESATGSSHNSSSLDLLQVKLKEVLSRKRFLLVLDDMWNENYERWDTLSTVFSFGRPGSKILVTTRNKSVSSIVRTVPGDYDLKGLSNEACIELFRRHTFMDENSYDASAKLEVFGQEILNKCKGSPLAIKTLAGLLRDRRNNSEWKDILGNEMWDLRESEILPSLMLSYYHLSPILKRCFAYSALFPKDYVFNKIELVILWMAEGYVEQKGKKRLEDIGASYFDELFMRSFFELSDRPPSNLGSPFSRASYKMPRKKELNEAKNVLHISSFFESSNNTRSGFMMHDLIHDLAQVVSGGIHCRREYDMPSEVLSTTRHWSFDLYHHHNDVVTEFEALKSLRTLLSLNNGQYIPIIILPTLQFQFQFLRVLCFRYCRNSELPDSIGKLKHLRLLDLSCSAVVRLPNSITNLYNLQTLILTGCCLLKELPKDIGNLVNLRHLFLPKWTSDSCEMPSGLSKLTCLQTLNTFIVGSDNISDLKELSQLHGALDVCNLENVSNNGTEEMVAILKNNPHLLGLGLKWQYYETKSRFSDLGREEKFEEDVLDKLQPSTILEALWIESYGGRRFPRWIGHPSFSNLETLHLLYCHNCIFLPHLRQLPLLRHLVIKGCNTIKMVGSESFVVGSSANNRFQSLETLRIERMTEWEEWPEVVEEEKVGRQFPCQEWPEVVEEEKVGRQFPCQEWPEVVEEEKVSGQFPCLRELIIKFCPKLRMFSHRFPGLVGMRIRECHNLGKLPQLLPSLQWLRITKCQKLAVLPCLPSIKRLALESCEQITTLFHSDHPPSSALHLHSSLPCLRVLEIVSLPTGFPDWQDDASHFSLTVDDVSDLKPPPNGFMQHLTALQELKIYDCRMLIVPLQNKIGFDPLPSNLQHLYICFDCHSLGKLPKSMCNLPSLKELRIDGARGLESLLEGIHNLTSLQELRLSNCENLKALPKELYNLKSLQEFVIESCPALVCFQERWLLTMLQRLEIIDCKNLESLPKDLTSLKSLRKFVIKSCPAIISFQETRLPTSLQEVKIMDCKNLESPPNELHTLTSLWKFEIKRCPALVTLQETGLPTAIRKLVITDCKNLESFPDMGLPTTLMYLLIKKCGKLNSLPRGLHKLTKLILLTIVGCSFLMGCRNLEPLHTLGLHCLTSLYDLTIGGCNALVSFPKGLLPTNLGAFCIKDCPVLESLHDGLSNLTFLKRLEIQNCPMLKQQYQKKEGKEWSKIAQIHEVLIDDEWQ